MPFPIDKQFIEETEKELGVTFPPFFTEKMMLDNGGELITDDDDWELYPFLDKFDNKRISRTCNHITLETNNARQWGGFPSNAVAIGHNGLGDYLVLLTQSSDNMQLSDSIFIWRHETCEVEKIADSIMDVPG